MNNKTVEQLIQGIGVLVELWTITYRGFISQGFDNTTAINHTRAFMSSMMETFYSENKEET